VTNIRRDRNDESDGESADRQSSSADIMAPILYPAAVALGVNPAHLGILIDVHMEVGLCHRPLD
jgi:TRAP-type C4-dicarboxylate transport system permease large subunit